ncbi:helix-turn-helix domain-containing protein [Pelotomaculum propionicicum]|uniref:Helix-turn-helix conjugative transposon-like domain-containing protein n=1 Tax=Pelotomaculum propionicicum TaxID=258475 RepID=A0A4Y7RDP6_9FIRM|nr:helix-turn-helix domain-containing protein [Pelotomaculum propionicicum]NLI14362.1 helix-turn-helix domain-containing protein [Peptococcaceae bacterium]TEB06457.1 hypothetical protein Pmgp_03715 [Pelotomaculum propionicicum]
MEGKPTFHELVVRAKCGDEQAFIQVVYRLNPAVKKYSRWSGHYVECYSDLITWLMSAIHQYPA